MSLHTDAVTSLTAFAPLGTGEQTDEQARLRERYLTHLAAHPDGLERGCRPDHITASTLVLSADLTEVLLTLHAKAGRWFQFGGHCEPGDLTLQGAAAREAAEESGVSDLSFSPLPVHLSEHVVPFCGSGAVHLDVRFAAVAPPQAQARVSEESLAVRWFRATALPNPELAEVVAAAHAWASANSSGGVIADASDHPNR